MATEPPSPPSNKAEPDKDVPYLRRISEFVLNILQLERTTEALKKENSEMEQRILALQRQVDDQAGQLKVLSEFVTKALEDRVQTRAEQAAIRAFERMATVSGLLTTMRHNDD